MLWILVAFSLKHFVSILYPYQNASNWIRSTCYVVPQFSSSGFIVASTIILLFSDIPIVILTNIRPNLSFSLKHVLYILTILIEPRPKLLRSLKPLPIHSLQHVPTSVAPATSAVAC